MDLWEWADKYGNGVNHDGSSSRHYLKRGSKSIRADYPKDVRCPKCGHTDITYVAPMKVADANDLRRLYKLDAQNTQPGQWFHIREFNGSREGVAKSGGGSFARVRLWGLVEMRVNTDDSTKKHCGRWRITEIGRQFVEGKLSIRCYHVERNMILLGLEGHWIKIDDIVTNFDFGELMCMSRGLE